ncbi:MAG: hypothetical protein HZB91_08690 [Elusimicrobia bacterium]|nr:hypothetical protein [Elusimicrobiota bacterium]
MSRETSALKEAVGRDFPLEAVHSASDAAEVRFAVERLQARRPAKIVVVPLSLSSDTREADAVKAFLGFRGAEKPPCDASGACPPPLKVAVPVTAVPPMEDHAYLAAILTERLRGLSKEPRRETVILVAPDPGDGRGRTGGRAQASAGTGRSENVRARKSLDRALKSAAGTLRRGVGYRAVRYAVVREDGTAMERARAVSSLRSLVGRAGSEGKVLVVPFALAWDGLKAIDRDLKGLAYTMEPKTIMPHPLIAAWVKEAASMGARLSDMRRFPGTDPKRVDALKALLRKSSSGGQDPGACSGTPTAGKSEEACGLKP